MTNDLELENTKGTPAQEPEPGVSSDSSAENAPFVEPEEVVLPADEPTAEAAPEGATVEADLEAAADEGETPDQGEDSLTAAGIDEETAAVEEIEEPQVDAGEAEEEGIAVDTPDEILQELAESEPSADDEVETSAAVDAGIVEDAGEADAEAAEVASEADDDRSWYVVHCYSGYENKVRHNLEQRIETMGMKDRIFDVVVPTEEEIEVKDGKRKTIERRVFPGYILVQMIMTEESWYVVRNTPGVTGFVGMGNEPTALRPEEVSQIIKRMEAEAPRIKVTYKIGQKVRIIDGPFNDFIGTVDEIDMERAKVRVMVSFFGRETPVELDFLQVEKA